VLVLLDAYDSTNHPVPLPDPIRAIEFHMDRLDLDISDLRPIFGSVGAAQAVLQRRRAMSLREIQWLHELLDLDMETLTQEYEVSSSNPAIETAALDNSATILIGRGDFAAATRSPARQSWKLIRDCVVMVGESSIVYGPEDVDTSSEQQSDTVLKDSTLEDPAGSWQALPLRLAFA